MPVPACQHQHQHMPNDHLQQGKVNDISHSGGSDCWELHLRAAQLTTWTLLGHFLRNGRPCSSPVPSDRITCDLLAGGAAAQLPCALPTRTA